MTHVIQLKSPCEVALLPVIPCSTLLQVVTGVKTALGCRAMRALCLVEFPKQSSLLMVLDPHAEALDCMLCGFYDWCAACNLSAVSIKPHINVQTIGVSQTESVCYNASSLSLLLRFR